jgi:8-oxo-dGTP pyrophosphatase MutT (NUDIX family)
VYLFGPALRASVIDHLAGFGRRAVPAGELTPAAVAICLVPGPGPDEGPEEACFVLTERAAGLRAHARQYALPGGRLDPGEGPEQAACREMAEEVGITNGAVLGLLDDYVTRSGYLMTPVVVWCEHRGPLAPSAVEVAAVDVVPLAELDHPDAPRLVAIPESDQPVVQLPIRGEWIHAPTAAVLLQFRDLCLHGRASRVGHLEQPVWAWR